jgi:hypothetical protein
VPPAATTETTTTAGMIGATAGTTATGTATATACCGQSYSLSEPQTGCEVGQYMITTDSWKTSSLRKTTCYSK